MHMINTFITNSLTTSDSHFLCYTPSSKHSNHHLYNEFTCDIGFLNNGFPSSPAPGLSFSPLLIACQYCESTRSITTRSLLIHAIEDRCFPGGVASVPYHLCTHFISDFDRCPSPRLSNRPLAVISFLSLSGP